MSKTILEQIEIDKTHINDFPLETEEGTKRAKEKFYEKAVTERNQYVEKQIQTCKNKLDLILLPLYCCFPLHFCRDKCVYSLNN